VTVVTTGKDVARDTVLFPRPFGWEKEKVPNLRWASTKVGEKVKLIAYASRAEALAGKFCDDSGVVKMLVVNPNEERAYYKVSSVDGNCGAPVVNTEGRVVGWHNATTATDTVFIPCTALACQKATGSAQSF